MIYRGRFAPTPSGFLHRGSLVVALASYLDARANNGVWILRIEDIDLQRSKKIYCEDILRTLSAFGLDWDELSYQSNHLERYESALQQLKEHIYYCQCSRKEWQKSAKIGELGAIYQGKCRNLQLNSGNVRLKLNNNRSAFADRHFGERSYFLADLGEPILKRHDGIFLYLLSSCVDDAAQNINFVVRGADLLPISALQIYLQDLLNYPAVKYLHLPLVYDAQGQKLSKSQGSAPLKSEILQELEWVCRHLNLPISSGHNRASLLEEALHLWKIKYPI